MVTLFSSGLPLMRPLNPIPSYLVVNVEGRRWGGEAVKKVENCEGGDVETVATTKLWGATQRYLDVGKRVCRLVGALFTAAAG